MNEIIQNLKANKTDGYTNFCEISEEMLNAIKELSQREYKENKKYKEVINKAINYIDEYRDYQDVHKQVGIDKYEDVREDILFEENIKELLDILKEVKHD